MPDAPQSYSHYKRYDPIFHFFVIPVFAVIVVAAIVHLVRNPSLYAGLHVIVAIAGLVAIFKIRVNSLKVQDRVIRLEERLRLANLLDASLRARIPEFSEAQLVALRFASDAELPALAARTLNEKLAPEAIKKSIQQWRPDNWRV